MDTASDVIVLVGRSPLATQVRAVFAHFYPDDIAVFDDGDKFADYMADLPPAAAPLLIIGPQPGGPAIEAMKGASGRNCYPRFCLLGASDEPWLDDLEVGAGDRLALPVRIGALLDRVLRHRSRDKGRGQGEMIVFGPYELKPGDGTLIRRKDGSAIKLTEKELSILLCLYDNAGERVERTALLDGVWGYGEDIETHTLETHIYRLRQKIEEDPGKPVYLVTDESGYRLDTGK